MMQLLVRRRRFKTFFGKKLYVLHVRVQLTDEEMKVIKQNSLTHELLYYSDTVKMRRASGLRRIMRNAGLTVGKLIQGVEISCKNVAELIGVEYEVKRATLTLKQYIEMASTFGGEEVINMDQILKELDSKG